MECNEKDFLAAYRGHMNHVYKDMSKIRKKADEN